jgi:nitroreductase
MSAAAFVKTASTDSPIHEVVAERWSPYAFRDKPVSQDELRSLFEVARWAPSSYNEQPWRYVVATRDDRAQFERLLSCLVEGNQTWAKHVPVLALGIVSLKFAKNGKDNRAAVHDLGLAAGNLMVEATARGDYRTWKTASRSPAPIAVKPLSSWSPTWKAAWCRTARIAATPGRSRSGPKEAIAGYRWDARMGRNS